jgi:secondary thiamine-phosphate synthase enzyme
MEIIQKEITLSPKPRGFNLITSTIISSIPEIKEMSSGTLNIFIKHTSASLTLNENADPDVREDLETYFNFAVPEDTDMFMHTAEGTDDMTSHIKSTIIGNSLNIPVTNGKLNLGIWQGIYLCEHRNYSSSRNLVLTLTGKRK